MKNGAWFLHDISYSDEFGVMKHSWDSPMSLVTSKAFEELAVR